MPDHAGLGLGKYEEHACAPAAGVISPTAGWGVLFIPIDLHRIYIHVLTSTNFYLAKTSHCCRTKFGAILGPLSGVKIKYTINFEFALARLANRGSFLAGENFIYKFLFEVKRWHRFVWFAIILLSSPDSPPFAPVLIPAPAIFVYPAVAAYDP